MVRGGTDTHNEPRADCVNTRRINGITKELTFTFTVCSKSIRRRTIAILHILNILFPFPVLT